MRKISGLYSRLAVWVLLFALLAACGSKSTTTTTSTTSPSYTYVHSVAFKSGNLYAWGANTYGQLGSGDTTGVSQLSPISISIANVSGISAGGTHTLAYLSDGTAKAWGNNGFGQVGNNTNAISWSPVPVLMMTPGSNPAAYTPLTGVTAVSAGGNFSLARDSNNSVWVWGDNTYGQLGIDPATLPYRYFAAQVNNPSTGIPFGDIARIAAGGAHILALTSGKTVWSWGNNLAGQLGYSPLPGKSASFTPNSVTIAAVNPTSLTYVTDIAAGGAHSLFIVNDNVNPVTVWACGRNTYGQLGDTTTVDRSTGVVQVLNIPVGHGAPVSVAAGFIHSLLLMSDKTVWAWGDNFFGQLGSGLAMVGSTPPQTSPVQVKVDAANNLTGITKIIAIGDHSLALDGSGQLWAWGANTFGQLGDGTSTNRNFAVKVNNLTTGSNLNIP
jgi:alpha-tubulin suppressor-like RCC1 family protein